MNKLNGKPLSKALARLAAEKDLQPECDHPKLLVEVEIIPGPDYLPGTRLIRHARLCQTCQPPRIYALLPES